MIYDKNFRYEKRNKMFVLDNKTKYRSFVEMMEADDCFFPSNSNDLTFNTKDGKKIDIVSECYYKTSIFNNYVSTCMAYAFFVENQAFWLADMIASYVNEVSTVIAKVDSNGRVSYRENNRGIDYFMVIVLQKIADDMAVFTIEMEDEEGQYSKVVQFIDYTDIKTDCVKFYLENGVLMFPEER